MSRGGVQLPIERTILKVVLARDDDGDAGGERRKIYRWVEFDYGIYRNAERSGDGSNGISFDGLIDETGDRGILDITRSGSRLCLDHRLRILERAFAIEHINIFRWLKACRTGVGGGKERCALWRKGGAVYLGAFSLGDQRRTARNPSLLDHPGRSSNKNSAPKESGQ